MSEEIRPQRGPDVPSREPTDEPSGGDSREPGGASLPAANDEESAPSERFVFTPPIDIYEDDDGLVLYADLPGVSAETLELQVQDNRLTLFGRVRPAVESSAVVLHQEYAEGDFLRSFILSDDVDHDRISAKLNNGVLKVVLPKAQRGEARHIPIRTD